MCVIRLWSRSHDLENWFPNHPRCCSLQWHLSANGRASGLGPLFGEHKMEMWHWQHIRKAVMLRCEHLFSVRLRGACHAGCGALAFIRTFYSHRIREWFGLEGTLKIIWFQPPCHEQGHLPPAQGAQSSIQPGLEHCQGGGSHSFSG